MPTRSTNPTAVLAAVVAILNAPCPGIQKLVSGCPCAACATLRSLPFLCTDCGYSGIPFVHACTCVQEWNAGEQACWEGRLVPRPEHKPDRPCAGSCKNGSMDNCQHTHHECPVCGDGSDAGEFFDPLEVVKAIRAVVAAPRR